MPVVGNMGYILYILLAIVGGFMALSGMGNFGLAGAGKLTLGALISLLTLSRSFVNPLGQVSMQFNMVMMALAGASRIFQLMDEKPEDDERLRHTRQRRARRRRPHHDRSGPRNRPLGLEA